MTSHKSWLHKIVLSGALIYSTSMLNAESDAPKHLRQQPNLQELSTSLKNECEKWTYLKQHINIKPEDYTSTQNKVGTFMKNNSTVLAFPIYIISLFSGLLITHWINSRRLSISFDRSPLESVNAGALLLTISTLASLLAASGGIFIADGLIYRIGEALEEKPKDCLKALAHFFRQWDTHKKNIPTQMLPLFEQLYADFDPQSGSLRSLMRSKAVEIVGIIIFIEYVIRTTITTSTQQKQA